MLKKVVRLFLSYIYDFITYNKEQERSIYKKINDIGEEIIRKKLILIRELN